MGENYQRGLITIPPLSGFSAKIWGNKMYMSLENIELEMKYLLKEEQDLLKQLRK